MKENQLDAVYSCLQHSAGIPERREVDGCSRTNPMSWIPTDTIQRYACQSEESFEEQKRAIELCVGQVSKYRQNTNDESRCIKNPIVYGSPGAGKSYVGSMTVLYTLSQGLNIISTALMALRAQALGGLHLHEIFKLPTSDGASIAPFAAANQAIQKIERKTHLHYALLTADVIFLDEAGQVSSEQLAITDIILCKMRSSQIPFCGVLII